jgi:NH3-dependent NAD+ synthetase
LAPLSSLYKSELYDLADYFNLSDIKEKNSGCLELTDIDAFSVPWNELDPILYLLVEKNMSPECIAKDFSIDLNWLRALNKRIFIQPLRTSTKKITLL